MTTTLIQSTVVRRRLSFRCARCRGVALAQAEWHDGGNASIGCGICKQKYVLPAGRDRGTGDADYKEQVRALAVAHGFDLPTATSVLEEIIPIDRARALRRPTATTPTTTPVRPNRKSLRTGLACGAVVVSLALLAMRRDPETDLALATPARRPVSATDSAPQATAESVPTRRESPVVSWHDEIGNLTEIVGPDPATVLGGLCREVPGLEPVDVKDSFPPNPGTRVGVVRRSTAGSGMLAVAIRRDPRTGRWFIGDRRGPIRLSPAHADAGSRSSQASSTPGGG